VKREANHALNERLRERRRRRHAWSAIRTMRRSWEEDTPSEPESSEEDMEDEEEEGEVIPPPHTPLRESLPLLDDIFRMQMGIIVGTRRPKRTRTEARPSTGSPL
jgi:hypothetical protein